MLFARCFLFLGLSWAACLSGSAASPVTPAHFALAAAYSRAHGGLALRVEQGGRVAFEDYVRGYSSDTPHRIYSGTKNFVALTVLLAQQDHLLDLNEPASKTLPEWRGDRRRSITLDELLTQTSGLDPGADIISPARDQMAAAVQVPLIATPGTQFHYGPVNYQALGEILKRKLRPSGRTVEGYMRSHLFGPWDIRISSWTHDDAGNPLMHAGLSLTPEAWGHFGECLLTEMVSVKKQLIDPKLFKMLFTGSNPNPAYGRSFWLNRPEPHPLRQKMKDLQPAMDGDQLDAGGPSDIYAAEGTSKQRLYLIPSWDLVIVRFGQPSRFSDGNFLSLLLTGRAHPDLHTH